MTLESHGYRVHDDDDDDPILLGADGHPVDTWRENYPYDDRMSRDEYEEQKRLLQIELLKLQKWSQANGHRHVIVFEGRDAAGKGGTIKRFMEHRMRYVLSKFDYDNKDHEVVGRPDPHIVGRALTD